MNNSKSVDLCMYIKIELNELLSTLNDKNYVLFLDILKNCRLENDKLTIYGFFKNISEDTKTDDFFSFMKYVIDKIYEHDRINHAEPINVVYSVSNNIDFIY